ncbi:MAG: phosphopantetheine-binding protein [Rhodocyclaceae bacterium]|nr:phosphopantetheine-binding protein [Rhodocyclaceae bacterium]
MTHEDIRAGVLAELLHIAPELEASSLRAHRPLRQEVDLDSMDWLNFLLALEKRFAVTIPEKDYRRLLTLDDLVDYLAARLSGAHS